MEDPSSADILTKPASTVPNAQEAALHLRAIRQFMENASVIQALTVRAAWVAAVGSFGVSAAGYFYKDTLPPTFFIKAWLGLLVVVLLVNFWPLWRTARAERLPFPSPVLMRVVRGMCPGLLVGFLMGLKTPLDPTHLATWWILGNGLALLAVSHLLPRSMAWLGLAFFLAGLTLLALGDRMAAHPQAGWACMAYTFGVFHLIYAAVAHRNPAQD